MNLVQGIALGLLRAYKLVVSPVLHTFVGPLGGCRFQPTCSVYTADAVRQHGILKGSALAARRICRCHPWGGCGDDPVPAQFHLALRKGTPQ
jgi:uncharacterized protein